MKQGYFASVLASLYRETQDGRSIRLLLALFVFALPRLCEAQAVATPPNDASAPESRLWRPILSFVISRLGDQIVQASQRTTEEPWEISLPDSSAAWQAFGRHLQRSLGARPVRPEDERYRRLIIGPASITGDSAQVVLQTGLRVRCKGSNRTSGFGNEERIYLRSFGARGWGSVATSGGVLHGDSVPCSP